MQQELIIRPFLDEDESMVIALWQACGLVVPANDPAADIARKKEVAPELFLVGWFGNRLVATVMGGYDGHRGWLNYLAVDQEFRFRGVGRQIVEAVERLLRQRGCAKINLQVRMTNSKVIEFYQSLGYTTDDVVSLGKRLYED